MVLFCRDHLWMAEVEVSGGFSGGPRRRRSAVERRRIVEETLEAGASVARVALKYGVNANQVFQWRRLHRDGKLGALAEQALKLQLCHRLRIEVVGEGVETQEEFWVLKECGIHLMQGYLFAKPLLGLFPYSLLSIQSSIWAEPRDRLSCPDASLGRAAYDVDPVAGE